MGSFFSSLRALFVSSDKLVTIDGQRYRIIKQVAEGGFSFVYLAEDIRTKHKYALKRILVQENRALEEGRHEIAVHKKFAKDHPNLLKVHASAILDVKGMRGAKNIYMLMPYYRKGALFDIILKYNDTGKHFSEKEILVMFLGICKGVAEFHNHSPPWAHRDIKPGNVLLDSKNRPVLMDFGSAAEARVTIKDRQQALTLQELAGERCTLPYRAPELFDVESDCTIDERTDIWSLGCTLYCMAFLHSPFEGPMQKDGSVSLAATVGKVIFPETHGYSKGLEELILFIMKRDPKERPFINDVIKRAKDHLQTLVDKPVDAAGTSTKEVAITIQDQDQNQE